MSKSYYQTKESVSEYIKMAEGFSGSELIEKLKQYLPVQASLLEIGSGPGTDWVILNSDFIVTGSDNSNEFLERLRKKWPAANFLFLDAVTLATENTFEGIYSNKVLHHLTMDDLKKSINRQHTILEKGGIICHSFWKGEGSENFKGMHVEYQLKEDLEKLFNPHFKVLLLESYQEFDKDDSLLFIGKKR